MGNDKQQSQQQPTKPGKSVVDNETAELEFERFCEAMDLDTDPSVMDEEDRKSFEQVKRRFVRAVVSGKLEVSEKGEPVLKPETGNVDEIIFYEPDGAAYMELDRAKKGQNVRGMHYIMSAITKQPEKEFARLKNRDYKICQAVVNLFLG